MAMSISGNPVTAYTISGPLTCALGHKRSSETTTKIGFVMPWGHLAGGGHTSVVVLLSTLVIILIVVVSWQRSSTIVVIIFLNGSEWNNMCLMFNIQLSMPLASTYRYINVRENRSSIKNEQSRDTDNVCRALLNKMTG
jgi:hypothetical protein